MEVISPGSDWQTSPAWMSLPRNELPLTQDTKEMTVPEEGTQNIALLKQQLK